MNSSQRRGSLLVPPIDIKDWKLDIPKLDELPGDDDEDEGDIRERNKFLERVLNWEKPILNEDQYQKFAEEHYIDVKRHMKADKQSHYRQGTLLHGLVQQLHRAKQWQLWSKFMLDVAKAMKIQILIEKSKNNSTCLHEAIADDQVDFIKYVGEISDRKDICHAIAATNARGLNCVHLAIAEVDNMGRSFELVDYLTRNANAESLKVKRGRKGKDDEGVENTCLHDLVDISLCKAYNKQCRRKGCDTCAKQPKDPQELSDTYAKQYVNVLRTMAEKCPDAMITMNGAKQSPYLFHVHTRSKEKRTENWGRLELSSTDEKVKNITNLSEKTTGEKVTKNQGPSPQLEENTNSPIPKHKKPTAEPSRVLGINVAKELMELCLSQQNFSNVCDSLFGHTCVELGLDDTTSSLLDGHSVQGAARDISERDAREHREELIQRFFDWLREERGVKRIIKLVVSDHPFLPCRDHIISDALKGFDIRYLDWDKEDLCMQSLAENGIAPNLQELWLSWSGRNSTLLGWSNKEYGLWKLDKLETVYISTDTHWERDLTNQKNVSRFTANMAQFNASPSQNESYPPLKGNRQGIAVKDADDGDSKPIFDARYTSQEVQGALKQGDIWIDAIRTFRKSIMDKVKPARRDKIKGQITVAIIDDGVDLEALETVNYIAGGWHPDRKAPDRRAMNAWYFSEKSHGTEMAKLVQLVCPWASLYVAKLDTKRLVYKSVAESAAKVRHGHGAMGLEYLGNDDDYTDETSANLLDSDLQAVDESVAHGANIISMSWTIYQAGHNAEGIDELVEAIKTAGNKIKGKDGKMRNTLMFCASEDSGYASYRHPYPATNCDTNIIKRVGSAGIYGERSDYVDPKAIDYLLPGEIVSSRKLCTGSSASTALAAGLSALILWCAALKEAETSSSSSTTEVNMMPGGQSKRQTNAPINGGNTPGTRMPPAVTAPKTVNFQTHKVMYGLFDALKTSQENPLVNITSILHQAAADDDPPAKFIELCTQIANASNVFRDTK